MPSLESSISLRFWRCHAAVAAFERCNSPLWVSDAAIKIAKSVHIGRYSTGLFAGPAPTSTAATIPNSANSPHPALVNTMVPAMVFLFGHLSIM